MAVGTGIFLIVIGGIASFAINDSIESIDLTLIGYICMGAGVLAIIVSLIVSQQRSNTSHTEIRQQQPQQPQQPTDGTQQDGQAGGRPQA